MRKLTRLDMLIAGIFTSYALMISLSGSAMSGEVHRIFIHELFVIFHRVMADANNFHVIGFRVKHMRFHAGRRLPWCKRR